MEGLALLHGPDGKGALIVSVQGLNEYALFGRKTDKYIGSFKLNHGADNPATEIDGLEIISTLLGPEYPNGLLTVHDHMNTNNNKQVLNANYKLKSLTEILDLFPSLEFEGFNYNPRKQLSRQGTNTAAW